MTAVSHRHPEGHAALVSLVSASRPYAYVAVNAANWYGAVSFTSTTTMKKRTNGSPRRVVRLLG
jgi:hypothetical protein